MPHSSDDPKTRLLRQELRRDRFRRCSSRKHTNQLLPLHCRSNALRGLPLCRSLPLHTNLRLSPCSIDRSMRSLPNLCRTTEHSLRLRSCHSFCSRTHVVHSPFRCTLRMSTCRLSHTHIPFDSSHGLHSRPEQGTHTMHQCNFLLRHTLQRWQRTRLQCIDCRRIDRCSRRPAQSCRLHCRRRGRTSLGSHSFRCCT